jgi:histidine triad (HIT) family protein
MERDYPLLAGKWLRTGEFRIIGRQHLFATPDLPARRPSRPVRQAGAVQPPVPAGRPLPRPAPRTTSGHYYRTVPDCLFCGIAAGRIPATIMVDGKRTIAFRDINPQAPTHVLVVPRDHFPDVAALAAAGDGLLDELVGTAREIAVADGIEATGYRIVFNTGQDGGQTVGHVHAHVLGGRPMTWPPG